MFVLTERPRRANPNRAAADHIGSVPGAVWTQQTSKGPRQVMITDEKGSFVPVEVAVPSIWEQFSGWVENEVPGGWLTAAGGAAAVAYLVLVPPKAPKK